MSGEDSENPSGLPFELTQVVLIIAGFLVSAFFAETGNVEVGVKQVNIGIGMVEIPISESIRRRALQVFGIVIIGLLTASISPFLLNAYVKTQQEWEKLRGETG